jgi:diacylglycerol kinase
VRPDSAAGTDSFRRSTVISRFRDALRGIWLAYRAEPHLRFHFFAASAVLAASMATGVGGFDALLLSTAVALVVALELVNTAVERAVDLATAGKRDPLAALAKEAAAGAVLVAAFYAAGIGLYIFAGKVGLVQTLRALAQQPWVLLLPAIALTAAYFGSRGKGS